jgi:phage putative head morphogenesis protein, SPP1 gp7 family
MQEAQKMLTAKELEEFKWDVNEYIKYGQENAINGTWVKQLENASARYHISRLEALKLQTQQSLEAMFGNQLDSIDGAMRNVYKSGYYHTAFEVQKGFGVGWDFAGLDEKQISKVINNPWAADGKNFSERIWGNGQKLGNELNTELTRNIILAQDPQKAIDAIARKMQTSKVAAGRLVMTEKAFFSSAAQRDSFNELGIDKYEIVATLDSHTSEICRELDGNVFLMKDYQPGVTAPPFHVWCRTTTVPHFDDDFGSIGERAARGGDGKVYYIPANVNYREWEQTFVVDTNLSNEMYDLKSKITNFDKKSYDGIWKDNVTVDDYPSKKAAIPAKQNYFEDKLNTTSGVEHDKFSKLLDDLNDFEVQGKDYQSMKARITEIQAELTKKRLGATLKENPYTQDRKDAAYWFKNQKEADDVLRPRTGELWKSFTQDQKTAAYEYTSGSGKFNRPLRGYDGSWSNFKGVGNVSLNNEGAEKQITDLASALDKSTYDFDIWLQRGVENSEGAISFLGITEAELKSSTLDELRQLLIDKNISDAAFVSTAASKGKGFSGYIFNIYAPKSTKMIYAEPFSRFGNGSGLSWDGDSLQSTFGYEFEVILQKGYDFKITKVDKSGGTFYFDLEVVLPESR